MTEARDEDEWRKRITAKLSQVPEVMFIDNLCHRLDSAALSAAITAAVWEDRFLGESRFVRLPVKAVWVATANNPQLSNELARRTVPINLDAGTERPWKGRDFTHPDLLAWVSEQRSRLTWACLVLCRAWISEDCPTGSPTLGGFNEATGVAGGILDVAGVPGFLDNLDQLYEESDAEHRKVQNAWHWRLERRAQLLDKS